MIVGTGIDIAEVPRIRQAIERFGDRFLERIFTPGEIRYCDSKANRAERYAARFAAKEAVLKALEPSDNIPPWRSIEVLLGARRCPLVHLSGAAQELAQQRGVENVHLSIAFGRDFAVAAVVADVVQNSARTHST